MVERRVKKKTIVCCIAVALSLTALFAVDAGTKKSSAESLYKKWMKGNNASVAIFTMKDISGDGVPELIMHDSMHDAVATIRNGKVEVVENTWQRDYSGGVDIPELYYNPRKHTLILHMHNFYVNDIRGVLRGDFWVETRYNGDMTKEEYVQTLLEDPEDNHYWVMDGAYMDKKILSESKKEVRAAIKKLKKESTKASKGKNDGSTVYEGYCSMVKNIEKKNGTLTVEFREPVPMFKTNTSHEKPISYSSKISAEIDKDCKWTFSYVTTPELLYDEKSSFDNVQSAVRSTQDPEIGGDAGLWIFIKNGKIIRVNLVSS